MVLQVPPLRERGRDVLALAQHFFERFAASLGRADISLAPETEAALLRYTWPGNIRELRNLLERAVLLANRPVLRPEDLGLGERPRLEAAAPDTSLTLEELERRHIEAVLREEGGRIEPAARRLGIHRSSLYNKIKRYGLSVSRE